MGQLSYLRFPESLYVLKHSLMFISKVFLSEQLTRTFTVLVGLDRAGADSCLMCDFESFGANDNGPKFKQLRV